MTEDRKTGRPCRAEPGRERDRTSRLKTRARPEMANAAGFGAAAGRTELKRADLSRTATQGCICIRRAVARTLKSAVSGGSTVAPKPAARGKARTRNQKTGISLNFENFGENFGAGLTHHKIWNAPTELSHKFITKISSHKLRDKIRIKVSHHILFRSRFAISLIGILGISRFRQLADW